MKTILSLVCFLATTCYAQTTYKLYETTFTCDASKKEIVNEGQMKIKDALNKLVQEKQLTAFFFTRNDKNQITMSITMTAENQRKFSDLSASWKSQFEKNAGVIASNFWKACPTRKDTLTNKTELMYPVIKNGWSPVAVVAQVDEKPDPNLQYNVVVDFTAYSEIDGKKNVIDSAAVNWGLADLGRIYNLHVAAGIPKEKIHFVAAVHGFSTQSFFTNAAYRERYKIDNPNIEIIEQLAQAGVKFLICGQSLTWMGYENSMLVPQAKVTLTAQTTLSSYQLKGYALKNLQNE